MLHRTFSCAFACSLACSLALAACGDDSPTGGSGQGGDNQAGQAPGGNGQGGDSAGGNGQGGDSAGGDNAGGAGEGGASCDDLDAAVLEALDAAKACNPTLDIEQCTSILPGLCCDVAVNPNNATAVAKYQDALADFDAAGCDAVCPAIPCPKETVGACEGENTTGSCVELSHN